MAAPMRRRAKAKRVCAERIVQRFSCLIRVQIPLWMQGMMKCDGRAKLSRGIRCNKPMEEVEKLSEWRGQLGFASPQVATCSFERNQKTGTKPRIRPNSATIKEKHEAIFAPVDMICVSVAFFRLLRVLGANIKKRVHSTHHQFRWLMLHAALFWV